jgi:hypothetical protein
METILEIKDYEYEEILRNDAGLAIAINKGAGFEVVTDKQSILLYIDSDSYCCERWGYFWCNDDPQTFIGAELRGVRLTDDALNEAQMKANEVNPTDTEFCGRIMFVNLETDRGTLQFVAYNEHNGHYGHEAVVYCRQLQHGERL